jgi:hypothetical protein
MAVKYHDEESYVTDMKNNLHSLGGYANNGKSGLATRKRCHLLGSAASDE